MKTLYILLVGTIVLSAYNLFTCYGKKKNTPVPSLYEQIMAPNPTYDSVMAVNLGLDVYGMKRYVLGFTRKIKNFDMDSLTAAGIEKAHQEYVTSLARAGQLVSGGVFLDNTTDINRIWIFNMAKVSEAASLIKDYPAVVAGVLTVELHPWYGPAALQMTTPLNQRLKGGPHHHH